MPQLITFAITCIAFASLAIWLSKKLQKGNGIPQGKVIYDDAGSWHKIPETLYSKELSLAGKPDYVIRTENGQLIPVEYKSAKAPTQPYESHIMQLAAYCVLIESHFGKRPSFGVIKYADRSFQVEFTAELKNNLVDTLDDMRIDLQAADVPRSHDQWYRCKGCGFNDDCVDSLYS